MLTYKQDKIVDSYLDSLNDAENRLAELAAGRFDGKANILDFLCFNVPLVGVNGDLLEYSLRPIEEVKVEMPVDIRPDGLAAGSRDAIEAMRVAAESESNLWNVKE